MSDKKYLINQLKDLAKALTDFDSENAKARDWAAIADKCMDMQEAIGDSINDLVIDDSMRLL